MATATGTAGTQATGMKVSGYPAGGIRFDWTFTLLSGWLIGGLFLDGWAHSHGRVDDTFFTPWHAVLYSGVLAVIAFLVIHQWRNVGRGYPWVRALPQGYMFSLLGAVMFIFGGGMDLVWHSLFGIEVNIETLLSPSHLFLLTAGGLIITGPVRAAWVRYPAREAGGWRELGPVVVIVTLFATTLTFFTQFANALTGMQASATGVSIDLSRYSDLYVMNSDGSSQTRLTGEPGFYSWNGAWSPDGSQIVFTRGEVDDNPEVNLYLVNSDGSGLRRLADLPGEEYVPSWSPDGTQIAFVSVPEAGQQIISTVNVDGSNLLTLTDSSGFTYMPVWSPDGTQLVFSSNRSGDDRIYVMDADGGNMREVAAGGLYNWGAVWSPDGRQIIFNSTRDGNTDIYAVNIDGTGLKRLTDDPGVDLTPAWIGDQIVFISSRDGSSQIYRMDAACVNLPDGCSADQTNLSHNPALVSGFPRLSPDGTKILYTANGHSTLPDPYQRENLGVASILVHSTLLIGPLLFTLRRWRLPVGTMTLVFTLHTALMAVFQDRYVFIPFALLAGLLTDLALWRLKPAPEQQWRFYLFAAIAPLAYFALYFVGIQLTQGGIGWTIYLWGGALYMTAAIGVFIAFLLVPPLVGSAPVSTAQP